MDTIRIEMDMPRPPEGWRHKGVCREPKNGEWFMDAQGHLIKATYDYVAAKHPILERVPWEPKPGELVWCQNDSGKVFQTEYVCWMPTWKCFRAKDDAHQYKYESRALADRIRAESEVQP
jgi:hypothetical protein